MTFIISSLYVEYMLYILFVSLFTSWKNVQCILFLLLPRMVYAYGCEWIFASFYKPIATAMIKGV